MIAENQRDYHWYVKQDNAGTLKTTLYLDYAIVSASGKREPLVTTVEIQTPDGTIPRMLITRHSHSLCLLVSGYSKVTRSPRLIRA